MTETLAPQAAQFVEAQLVHDRELAHMAALIVEASMRPDLSDVAAQHRAVRGETNPNQVSHNTVRVAGGNVPERSENVYRTVTERAIGDLAVSGVVRGAYTARAVDGVNVKANTTGHSVYWNEGETGKKLWLRDGFIIEAGKDDAAAGWVTADQVKGVWGRDSDGLVKNILPTKK